jgi:hypothetical protein
MLATWQRFGGGLSGVTIPAIALPMLPLKGWRMAPCPSKKPTPLRLKLEKSLPNISAYPVEHAGEIDGTHRTGAAKA